MVEINGKQYEIIDNRYNEFLIVRTSDGEDKIVKIFFPPDKVGDMDYAYEYLQSAPEIVVE